MILIFDLDDTLFPRLSDNYTEKDLKNISLYPFVEEILSNKHIKHFLVTKGDFDFQNKKIDNLGIKSFFNRILVCQNDENKKTCFQEIISNCMGEKVFVIGDRINSEIKWGNQLGLITVHFKRGKYKDLKPIDNYEVADYEFTSFEELKNLLNEIKKFEK